MSDGIYAVKIYDESSKVYQTFLATEASKFFDAYIKIKKLNEEHIDQESYLFATKQNARTQKNDYFNQNQYTYVSYISTKKQVLQE